MLSKIFANIYVDMNFLLFDWVNINEFTIH